MEPCPPRHLGTTLRIPQDKMWHSAKVFTTRILRCGHVGSLYFRESSYSVIHKPSTSRNTCILGYIKNRHVQNDPQKEDDHKLISGEQESKPLFTRGDDPGNNPTGCHLYHTFCVVPWTSVWVDVPPNSSRLTQAEPMVNKYSDQ